MPGPNMMPDFLKRMLGQEDSVDPIEQEIQAYNDAQSNMPKENAQPIRAPMPDPMANASVQPSVEDEISDLQMAQPQEAPPPAMPQRSPAIPPQAPPAPMPKQELNKQLQQEEPDETKRMQDLLNSYQTMGTRDQMQEAQLASNDNLLNARLAGLANKLSGTVAQVAPANQDFFEGLEKTANRPVEQLKELTEQEKKDPKSPASAIFRQYLKDMGVKVPDQASFEVMEKIAPFAAAQARAKIIAEGKKAALELGEKKLDLTKKTQEKRLEQADKRIGISEGKEAVKSSKYVQSGGGLPMQQQRTAKQQADNLFITLGLPQDKINNKEDLEKYIDDKKLDSIGKIQVVESALETAKLLVSQGVVAQSTLDKLLPKNINMKVVGAEDFMNNKINPAKQKDFLKMVLKLAAQRKESANARLKEFESEHTKTLPKIFQESGQFKNLLNKTEATPQLDNRVKVINPQGQSGTISREKLQEYLQKGYTEVK